MSRDKTQQRRIPLYTPERSGGIVSSLPSEAVHVQTRIREISDEFLMTDQHFNEVIAEFNAWQREAYREALKYSHGQPPLWHPNYLGYIGIADEAVLPLSNTDVSENITQQT